MDDDVKKWVDELNDTLDTGTIPQQVEAWCLLIDQLRLLTDRLKSKFFLVKSLGLKVAPAAMQDLLKEGEEEKCHASFEKLQEIIRDIRETPLWFGPDRKKRGKKKGKDDTGK